MTGRAPRRSPCHSAAGRRAAPRVRVLIHSTTSSWLAVLSATRSTRATYHPLTKPLLRERSGLEVATYAMVAGTITALPLLPFGWHQMIGASASAWTSALYLGLLPSALGFVLWGYAVANLPMASSTSLLYLVPAVAVLIGFVWLGEAPRVSELLGGLVVIAGVVLISQGDRIMAPRASDHCRREPETPCGRRGRRGCCIPLRRQPGWRSPPILASPRLPIRGDVLSLDWWDVDSAAAAARPAQRACGAGSAGGDPAHGSKPVAGAARRGRGRKERVVGISVGALVGV
jgi:uncharacterized membrane protein